MLTLSQVKENYPSEVFRRNPKAVLVEYLQHELLDSIYKDKDSRHLSFVGGTAIRIVYKSRRFSEDLDFDNLGLTFPDFENILKNVIFDMKTKGFAIEFKFVEKGAYHCYIRFPELLQENNLTTHQDEKILVRIDAVRKKKLCRPEIFTLSAFAVYRQILVNPPAIILSQKLIAILQRKRVKSRDFYDVSYLLGLAKPDYNFIEEVHGLSKSALKAKLFEKADSLNMEELARESAPLLIDPRDQERIRTFRQYIRQEL